MGGGRVGRLGEAGSRKPGAGCRASGRSAWVLAGSCAGVGRGVEWGRSSCGRVGEWRVSDLG